VSLYAQGTTMIIFKFKSDAKVVIYILHFGQVVVWVVNVGCVSLGVVNNE
jgi:hypothetical protein